MRLVSQVPAERPAPPSVLLKVLLASACAGLPIVLTDCLPSRSRPAPTTATLAVPSLQVRDQAEVTRDGLTVALNPITVDNFRRFPQIHRMVTWNRSVPVGGQLVSVPGNLDTNVVPLPAFQVRIANHTGHVIRFTQSVFRLQDNLGRTYQLFAGTPDLVAWNEGVWAAAATRAPDILPQVLPQLRSAVGQLQLLGRSTELLNDDEWTGYLVFNLNVNTDQDYVELLNTVNQLTVRLAEIPVEVNEAGTPTRTTEFAFALDRTQGSLRVTCPEGTAPSLAQCSY